MKIRINQTWITGVAILEAFLAVVVTVAGIATAFGHVHLTFVSLWGQTVTIQNGGLYSHESVSMAAQGVGMDLVTLLVVTPLLLLGGFVGARGSLRGQLLRVGAFFYFTYAYLVILFGVVYNPLFLVYVVMLSAGIAGLVLSLLSVDAARLPELISPTFRRRTIGWTVVGVNIMFLLLWLSRIVPSIGTSKPPVGLETYTTLSVQAADLSIVIPLSILTGVLLLRHHPVGYLLAAPVLFFLATMGLALAGMVAAMALMGTQVGVADTLPAAVTATVGMAMALHFLAQVQSPEGFPMVGTEGASALAAYSSERRRTTRGSAP